VGDGVNKRESKSRKQRARQRRSQGARHAKRASKKTSLMPSSGGPIPASLGALAVEATVSSSIAHHIPVNTPQGESESGTVSRHSTETKLEAAHDGRRGDATAPSHDNGSHPRGDAHESGAHPRSEPPPAAHESGPVARSTLGAALDTVSLPAESAHNGNGAPAAHGGRASLAAHGGELAPHSDVAPAAYADSGEVVIFDARKGSGLFSIAEQVEAASGAAEAPRAAAAVTGLRAVLAAEAQPQPLGVELRRAFAQRWRLVGALLVVVACFGVWRAFAGASRERTLERSLARHLIPRGLEVDPLQVAWLSREPNWLGVRPALFAARHKGELRDVYYADVRVDGSSVVDIYALSNTTRTSSADEDTLVSARGHVAFAARIGATYNALVVLDTRGESAALTRHWPWYAKLQNAVTNLQDSGRMRAFGVRRYDFTTPVGVLKLSVDQGRFAVLADGRELLISPEREKPLLGGELVEAERVEKGQPGLITWVVDTVRRVPWIGRGPVEWLEHTVFGLTDRANRAYHEVVKTDTAAEVKQALAVSDLPKQEKPASVLPEVKEDIGWPPPALTPVLPDKVQGEGVWLPVVNDAFAAVNPSGLPLFQQTFVRVDQKRVYTRVYVTMWDPRLVQLGMVMGTKEPESATGETGNGMIPRDPYVLSHLVGAFNGGFQAMHGEFGMMAGKRVYLPPKPYAATVAVFEDGRTQLGAWPGPGRHVWDETFATSQIPAGMVAMRQNLTSVVEGATYNPWQRWWWGAAPEWAEEQTFIHRSGLCLTREGFLAYFWGESMGPEELGKAMLAARCERGMHLDMNAKHTGLEFYRPYAQTEQLPELGRALRSTEYDGAPPEMRNMMRFRARLAVTTMAPLRFPRYLGQDPRDYFYLLRKPTLPGADLQLSGHSVPFSTRELPTEGFPHPFARARADSSWLVRIDATRAVPKPLADASLTRALAHVTSAKPVGPVLAQAGTTLYARYLHGHLRAEIGRPPPGAAALCVGPLLSDAPNALAAIGVDAEGFLVYAETATPGLLGELLRAAGVAQAIALPEGRLVLADASGPRAVDGQAAAVVDEATSLALMAETRAPAQVLFPDVAPLPYRKWGWLQDQRVRYFPNGPARFQAPESAR
jgi:hypothetical protein